MIFMKLLTQKYSIPNGVIAASRKRILKNSSTHIHEFFEIEMIISGSGICVVDGLEYPLSAGDLFLLSPVNTHEVRSTDAEVFNVMFRCEDGSGVLDYPLLYDGASPRYRLEGEDRELAYRLLAELVAVYGEDLRYARLLLGCLLGKLSRIGTRGDRIDLPYIRKACLYIAEHFRSGVTLSDTAAYLGLAAPYFSDLFTRETGMNFKTYLDGIRFSYAKNLLAFTDLPVSEVHRASGFSDYANFSRRFRSLFGVTPSAYREERKHTHP